MTTEIERSEKMRVLNIQRCAEAMQLLYQTYIIEQPVADERGKAIQAINKMIVFLGGDDTISKIEAAPWSARMRESGEKDLIELEKSVKKDIHQLEIAYSMILAATAKEEGK